MRKGSAAAGDVGASDVAAAKARKTVTKRITTADPLDAVCMTSHIAFGLQGCKMTDFLCYRPVHIGTA
jgi:hypothetical protein